MRIKRCVCMWVDGDKRQRGREGWKETYDLVVFDVREHECADKHQLTLSHGIGLFLSRALCQCQLTFTIDQDMEAPVYVYYGLGKFYQNHRSYVKSRSFDQLKGQVSKKILMLGRVGSGRWFVITTVRVQCTTYTFILVTYSVGVLAK